MLEDRLERTAPLGWRLEGEATVAFDSVEAGVLFGALLLEQTDE